jgi:hypothetical protein
LLGLLLVVLGAAAYFYSMERMTPEEGVAPVAVPKQPIIPPPAPETRGETALQGQEVPATDAANQAAVRQEVPQPAAPGAQSGSEAVTTIDGQAQTTSAEPAETAVAKSNTPTAAGPSDRDPYTLLAGAYVTPLRLQQAVAKVKTLGYQPRTLRDRKVVEVTRVRIGAFAPALAQAKLAELKKLAPEAFTLPEGELVAVYAASHYEAAAHHAFAERLRQAGVGFVEEKAMVRLPMTELFFGNFPDRRAAERAAAKGRQAGLDILVFKRP